MILNETYPLANGVQVPKLGLGTWFIDDAEAAEAVREAVKLGYRLIDTAQAYGNERGVGEGVRTCGVRREELFVASKIAAPARSSTMRQVFSYEARYSSNPPRLSMLPCVRAPRDGAFGSAMLNGQLESTAAAANFSG